MLNRPASQMSGGEQQMLALGRTLMTQPQMLLLDEPCEGISPVLVQSIAQALAKLKQGGYTLLIAEQNKTLHALADQVMNLAGGVVLPVPASTQFKVS
jgi:branched-chain amino acid transport system ATP-binding protein